MLQVDVDDAWNLVGCLDTHLKRIVFIMYYFIIHVVVFCFKPCNCFLRNGMK
ncbi:hypothetical protein Hanom_Chr02g00171441 [Helianthus anomalus]